MIQDNKKVKKFETGLHSTFKMELHLTVCSESIREARSKGLFIPYYNRLPCPFKRDRERERE